MLSAAVDPPSLKTCFYFELGEGSNRARPPWLNLLLAASPQSPEGLALEPSLPRPSQLIQGPSLQKKPHGKQKKVSSTPAGEPGGPRP